VGGKLEHSYLLEEAKHPLLISADYFTKLVILDRHKRLLHAGVNTIMTSIREEFWPISAKAQVKKYLKECVICSKVHPIPGQLMGQLPAD